MKRLQKEVSGMTVQFITDDQGRRTAVIIPLAEWEALMNMIESVSADRDSLTPEDEKDRRQAYAELRAGESLDLQEAMKEW
jgi:hypothetical protein